MFGHPLGRSRLNEQGSHGARECSIEFLNGVPKCTAGAEFSAGETLFTPQPRGGALDHFLVQGRMLLGGGREGGFFTMIGRKRG